MKKIMKIPFYVPLLGIIISFILFFIAAQSPNMSFVIAGVLLLHLSGWILTAKFFLGTVGFFGTVLND